MSSASRAAAKKTAATRKAVAKKATGAKAPAAKAAPKPAPKAAPTGENYRGVPVIVKDQANARTRIEAIKLFNMVRYASHGGEPIGTSLAEVDALERYIRTGELPKAKRTSREAQFSGGIDPLPTAPLGNLAGAEMNPLNGAAPPPPPPLPEGAFDAQTGLPMSAAAQAVV